MDDAQGRRVGTLAGVYEDATTCRVAWFLIRLGRFSTRYVLAPPADVLASRNRVWLPYLRETIECAPLLYAPPEATTPELETQLHRHYRLDGARGRGVGLSARRLTSADGSEAR